MDESKSITKEQVKAFSQADVLAMILGKDNTTDSLKDKAMTTKDSITKSMKDSKALNDAYGNSLTATGTEDKVKSFAKYGFSNDTLNFPLWLALYNDSWVFKKAIDKPAQDMVRCGVTIQNENENKQKVMAQLKKSRFDLIQLLTWGRLFGGSVAVIMFDNFKDADYKTKLNVDKIKKSQTIRMYVTDRWYGVAPDSRTVSDMNDIDFGKPIGYNITFADGKSMYVHHDYVLRFENRVAPKIIKNGQLQGWGYAEGSHILNELSRDDQLKSAITSLLNKALIEVIKMSGMRGVFMGADAQNQEQLMKRLEMVNWARNFNSLTFLDKDDEYQEHGFSGLGGLSDLLEKNMWLVAAAMDMPNILFGHLNNGLGEDNESLERYDETIQNLNESYYRPVIEKYISILFKKYDIDEKPEFVFNSLLMKKQDKERMEAMKEFSSVLSGMLSDGVITPKLYAKAMQKYISKGTIDLGLTDEEIEKLDDNIKNEMENINLDEDDDEEVDMSFKNMKLKK